MANKQIKIKPIRPTFKMPESKNGNHYDTYVAGVAIIKPERWALNWKLDWKRCNDAIITEGIVRYKEGDIVVLYLGFATDIGKGYEGHLLPRSSTFPNYGLLLANSMGIIDDSYCGDGDEWRGVMYATRNGALQIGDRLLQMSFEKTLQVDFKQVEMLGNTDRGGYGSTNK